MKVISGMENLGFEPTSINDASDTDNRPTQWETAPTVGYEEDIEMKKKPENSVNISMKQKSCISHSQNDMITFSWENLTMHTVPKKPLFDFWKNKSTNKKVESKVILKNVSGCANPGEVLAVMGSSGAGKSSLMNALTFKNLNGLKIMSGKRYANGAVVTPTNLTSVSAYIQQDDLFMGMLTVKEHLIFQALVRMDKEVTYPERLQKVEDVAKELGLMKCYNTIIGVPGRIRGISGGEMKRLSFASEILTNPPLMFCDEPTSGLDSYMAQSVVEELRKLAEVGKTIVCTIHQPSSQLFHMFDRLLLMAEGRVAYHGDLNQSQPFFNSLGYPCPLDYNPADHFIKVLAVEPGTEAECRDKVNQICDNFNMSAHGESLKTSLRYKRNHSLSDEVFESPENQILSYSVYKTSWWEQFKALMWRSWISVIREPMIMRVKIVQTIVVAILLGIVFMQQVYDRTGIMNINGAIFILLINTTFTNIFTVVNVFCEEQPIFLREHFNGMYRSDVYFITKQLTDLPMSSLTTLLSVSIFYYIVAFNPLFVRFVICCIIVIILAQASAGFGYMISCVAEGSQMALALAPPLVMPFMIFGGFYLNAETVPVWLIWIQYISWFFYSNEALLINQWVDANVICDQPVITAGTNTTLTISASARLPCFPDGEAVLEFYGFHQDNFAFDVVILIVLMVGIRIIAYLCLLFNTNRKR